MKKTRLINVDVMIGERHYKTLHFHVPAYYDRDLKEWVINYEDLNGLKSQIIKDHPILKYSDFSLKLA